MTRTKTIWALSIAAGLLVASPGWSQDAAQVAEVPPSVRAGIQTDVMVEKLHLSPEQRTQVEAINLKFAKQMQPVLEASSAPWTRMREVKQVDEAKDAELRALLSAQQFEAYLAAKDELRDRIKQKALASKAANP